MLSLILIKRNVWHVSAKSSVEYKWSRNEEADDETTKGSLENCFLSWAKVSSMAMEEGIGDYKNFIVVIPIYYLNLLSNMYSVHSIVFPQ